LGDVLRTLGRNKEAIEAYQKSLTINPDNLMVREKLKELEQQIQQPDK
jgi:predicted negative regulator of RcsB-dependent stress response